MNDHDRERESGGCCCWEFRLKLNKKTLSKEVKRKKKETKLIKSISHKVSVVSFSLNRISEQENQTK